MSSRWYSQISPMNENVSFAYHAITRLTLNERLELWKLLREGDEGPEEGSGVREPRRPLWPFDQSYASIEEQ